MNFKTALKLIVGISIITISFVWTRLEIVKVSYELNRFENRQKTLQEECNSLNLKLNEIKTPVKLEFWSKKLEMKAPKPGQWIILKNE
jgi:cell division protein FtsL